MIWGSFDDGTEGLADELPVPVPGTAVVPPGPGMVVVFGRAEPPDVFGKPGVGGSGAAAEGVVVLAPPVELPPVVPPPERPEPVPPVLPELPLPPAPPPPEL